MTTRIYKITVLNHNGPTGEPYYDHYLFVDRKGLATKRAIRVHFWNSHYGLFDRPQLKVEYIHQDDTIDLTAKQICQIMSGETSIKLG